MPLTRDNLFNLEQYSKGYVYQLYHTLSDRPKNQRKQLRTLLAYVCDVIDARWVTPRHYLDNETTTELASIVERPTAFAVLDLAPTDIHEVRYILLKACVDEIYVSQKLAASDFEAPTRALNTAFNELSQRAGPSFFKTLLKEFDDCAVYFFAAIPFCLYFLSASNQLSKLLHQFNASKPSTDDKMQALSRLIDETSMVVNIHMACFYMIMVTINLRIAVCATRKYLQSSTRELLAAAPTLYHRLPHMPATCPSLPAPHQP